MTGKAGSFLLVLCLLLGLSGKLQSKAVLVGHSNVFNLRTFTEEENSESNGFRLIEETNIFSLNTKDKSPGEEIPSGLSLVFETNLFSLNTKKNKSKDSSSTQLTLVFETNPFSLNTKPYEDPRDPGQSNSSFSLVFETEIFGLNTHPKDSAPPPNGTKRIGGTLTIVHETEIFLLSTHPIFRPLIDTLRPTEMENGNILLEAEILSDGGLPILEQGFEISRHGNFLEGLSYSAAYNPQDRVFSYLLTPPDRKESRYFRAFARNAVGLKYGETHKLTDSSPFIFFFPGKMLKGWKMAGWTPSGSVLLYNLRMVGCIIQVWDGSLVTPMPTMEFGYGLDRKIGYGRKGSSIPTFSSGRTRSGCISFIRMKPKIPLSPTRAENSFPLAKENNFR